jgi:O-antigen ligase
VSLARIPAAARTSVTARATPTASAVAAPTKLAQQSKLAFNLYLLFMVSWFLHLPARIPVLGLLRVDLALLCIIAALIVVNTPAGHKTGIAETRTNRLIVILVGYAVISAPFVEWPGTVIKIGLPDYAKALVFYYFTTRLVTNERQLRRLLFVFVLCQTLRVLEPVYLHFATGYWGSAATMADYEMLPRLSGAPSDVVNPNGLAFIIVTVIPFAHHLWTRRRLGGLAYILVLPILLYALSLTGSRSGMVALAITFAAIWYRSRRKLLLTAIAVITVVTAIPYMSADLQDRYLSIVDSHTKNAQTAEDRIEGWYADFGVAMRRPLLGYGLGTSLEANYHYSGRNIPSHNLITQVLQELGFVGLTIFLMLLGTIVVNVRRALRDTRTVVGSNDLLLRLSRALEAWLVMNILFSLFSYGLASYEWYFIAGLAQIVVSLSSPATAPDTGPPSVTLTARQWPRPVSNLRSNPA